jgi:hypothetical protein
MNKGLAALGTPYSNVTRGTSKLIQAEPDTDAAHRVNPPSAGVVRAMPQCSGPETLLRAVGEIAEFPDPAKCPPRELILRLSAIKEPSPLSGLRDSPETPHESETRLGLPLISQPELLPRT